MSRTHTDWRQQATGLDRTHRLTRGQYHTSFKSTVSTSSWFSSGFSLEQDETPYHKVMIVSFEKKTKPVDTLFIYSSVSQSACSSYRTQGLPPGCIISTRSTRTAVGCSRQRSPTRWRPNPETPVPSKRCQSCQSFLTLAKQKQISDTNLYVITAQTRSIFLVGGAGLHFNC